MAELASMNDLPARRTLRNIPNTLWVSHTVGGDDSALYRLVAGYEEGKERLAAAEFRIGRGSSPQSRSPALLSPPACRGPPRIARRSSCDRGFHHRDRRVAGARAVGCTRSPRIGRVHEGRATRPTGLGR